MAASHYLSDILEFFNSEKDRVNTLYRAKADQRNSFITVLFGITSICLTLALLYVTMFSPLIPALISLQASILDNASEIPVASLTITNTSQSTSVSGNVTLPDTDKDSSSIADLLLLQFQIIKTVSSFIFISFAVICFFLFGSTRGLNKLQDEINEIQIVITSLFLIKTRWYTQLVKKEVRENLLRFYEKRTDYKNRVLNVISHLEQEENKNEAAK